MTQIMHTSFLPKWGMALLLGLGALALASCGRNPSQPISGMPVDHYVKAGETFEISLPSNPSTGYSWHWTNREEAVCVDSVSHTYTGGGDQPGSGGTDTWVFQGKRAGECTLVLKYFRSWENPPAPADTKAFRVLVQ
jgi:inhibitor of cysteine peptidase